MAELSYTDVIAAPADEVWATVRRFGDGSWMGVDVSAEGEGEGALRRITIGGGTIVERCERLDDEARVLAYTVVEGPMPFTDYHSTMRVSDEDGGSRLTWSAVYEPVGDPAQAEDLLQRMYAGGAGALKRHLEG